MQTKYKIGNHLSNQWADISTKGCRTEKQREAVEKIINYQDFDFACSDPFIVEKPGESYNCTFVFRYFLKNNIMMVDNITPTGRVKNVFTKQLNN